jgi:cytochrome c oxidase accessory protein FixG
MEESELPQDRLATTTEKGHRVYINPLVIRGHFRKLRENISGILVIIYLAIPWIKIHGTPILLLDITHRNFSIFGFQFWADDGPLLFFILAGFIFLIAFLTALAGRIWCGWLCPQTLFIEMIYRKIEEWVEGPAKKRTGRNKEPWSLSKGFIKTTKWTIYIIISWILTHTFLAYFIGISRVQEIILLSPSENMGNFIFILISTGIILFDFGWFREQFCIIACPYGRFQSVLLDANSLIVGYDASRGEPRSGSMSHKKGDCINCKKCIEVCPTGIDIRRGLQMECIACTSCIDACDEMMLKVKKPSGLIRYTTENKLKGINQSSSLRTYIYAGILISLILGFGLSIKQKQVATFTIIRVVGDPYKIANNRIINQFSVSLRNRSSSEVIVELRIDQNPEDIALVCPLNNEPLSAQAHKRIPFFIMVSPEHYKEENTVILKLHIKDGKKETTLHREIILAGPQ